MNSRNAYNLVEKRTLLLVREPGQSSRNSEKKGRGSDKTASAKRLALNMLPIVAFFLFLFRVYQVVDLHAWILAHVLMITFVVGDYLQGVFAKGVEAVNREAERGGKAQLLGLPWLFGGFVFGVLFAAAAGTGLVEILSSSSLNSFDLGLLTALTSVLIWLDYLAHYRRRTERDAP